MRIEGLKNGLMSLTFPVRIQPNWLENHGYPVSIFYGDILLYFPAVLRIIGISIQDAYRFLVIIVHIATAVTAYFCFHKINSFITFLNLFYYNIFILFFKYSIAILDISKYLSFLSRILFPSKERIIPKLGPIG
mgnify:CR=1 FL=1